MKKSIIALVIMFLLSSPAIFAFGWQNYDFGTSPFDHNNNWSPITYPYNIGNLPSPGDPSGEDFDLEGLNFAVNNNTVNLSLTNSFGYSAYSADWGQYYNLGDIFFGFDGNMYQYAVDVSTGHLWEVDTWVGIPKKPGTYFGTSIATEVGAWQIATGRDLGAITSSMTYWAGLETDPLSGDGDTYVWEFAFDADRISAFSNYNSINFSNTVECGNDLIRESYSAVPEPTTMLLFGIGLAGTGILRRRKNL